MTKGDEWVQTGHYSDSRGTVAGGRTSEGGKAISVTTDDGRSAFAKSGQTNNMYATHDGNVYKNTGTGWQTYEDGSWQPVEKPETRPEAKQRTTGTASAQQPGARTAGTSRAETAGTGARTMPTGSGSTAWSHNSAQLERDQAARSHSMQRTGSVGGGRGGRRR